MDFSETIVVYDLKLAIDDRSDKKFLFTSKLCPQGTVCPMHRSYIHVLNHEKNCIKSDFKEKKNVSPGGCLSLPRGYIHALSHEKKMYKSDFKDIFLNLQKKEHV